jgi:ribosomal protein L29
MSTHEKCPECEKQREALLIELFPEKLQSECGDWTLSQLQQIKKSIASHKQSQESIANSTAGQTAQNKLTIGNSLLGLKMSEIPGQPNTVDPGATIGNSLFGKRVNEV